MTAAERQVWTRERVIGADMTILAQRIVDWSDPEPNTGCWLWSGYQTTKGYGVLDYVGIHHLRAHRASWLAFRGQIPEGLLVCHHCDVPSCVNPKHLFLGTALDNTRDSMRKGRSRTACIRPARVIRLPKLNCESVRYCRSLSGSQLNIHRLARSFGVDRKTIRDAISRHTWKHVE